MNFSDFFKSLKLDTWYKVFVYLGGIFLTVSFFLEVKGITNWQLQLLAGGIFFLGVGEWKNHKVLSGIKPPNVYTGPAALVSTTVRKPDFFGLFFDFVGLALLGLGVWSIIKPLI